MAMKRFLLRLSGFLVLALVSYIALVATVVQLNRRALTNCTLNAGTDSVILGDSHTAWAINDAGIAGVQNISLNAEGYKYTYPKLQHLLSTESGVKRVYLSFGYHNLSSYFDEYIVGSTFRFFAERYISVLTLSDLAELVKNNPRDASDLFKRILKEGLSSGIRGSCPLYGKFPDERRTEVFDFSAMEKRIAEQYYLDGRVRSESALNLEYLEKIVALCKASNIELVLLNTPMHEQYRQRIPEKFRALHDQFIAKHHLRSFDFGDLPLSDGEFLPDGDHTNYRGAVLTSQRFAEYHRRLLVAHD
jgi:hypothetical protein